MAPQPIERGRRRVNEREQIVAAVAVENRIGAEFCGSFGHRLAKGRLEGFTHRPE